VWDWLLGLIGAAVFLLALALRGNSSHRRNNPGGDSGFYPADAGAHGMSDSGAGDSGGDGGGAGK
jgi:hypothetical protein